MNAETEKLRLMIESSDNIVFSEARVFPRRVEYRISEAKTVCTISTT